MAGRHGLVTVGLHWYCGTLFPVGNRNPRLFVTLNACAGYRREKMDMLLTNHEYDVKHYAAPQNWVSGE
jgi:hypothetical protein